MRFVVYGPGAIGGVVASRLHQHGEEVVLVARGAHGAALRSEGLHLRDPDGETVLHIRTVEGPSAVDWRDGDVVLLAVKSQDSAAALTDLAASAPHVPVFCMQNGVRNEPEALRRFASVYGVTVNCPCVHLEPGVVEAHSSPCTGILDVGRFPTGVDELAEALAETFRRATFDSRAIGDIARWKWRKLITNLGNAIEVVCGPPARRGPIGEMAAAEGEACLAAAGIDAASPEDDVRRRGELLALGPVAGRSRPGGSTWQSVSRGSHAVETDYLNGEVVLLGRIHGVPTPVNALLQQLANDVAARGGAPGGLSPEEFLARLARELADVRKSRDRS